MKKNPAKRKIHIIMLIIYTAVLFIPGSVTLVHLMRGDVKTLSQAERRPMTTLTDVALAQGLSQKMERFEDLVEDQLAWRDNVTIAFNRLMVFGFRRPTAERVVFGKNGYWFLTGTAGNLFSRVEFARNKIAEDTAKMTGREYARMQRAFASDNITVVTIFAPTKHFAFRDKLPIEFKKIYQKMDERNIDKIVQALRHSSPYVYYPLDLVRSFPEDHIFNRRSFHWHEGGAQRLLHALFKEKKPFAHLNLNAVPIKAPYAVQSDPLFDIARILGLGGMPYTFTQFRTSVSAKPVYDTDYKNLEAFMSNKDYLKMTASSNKNGLKALLITDSFGLAARHYLELHFEKTAFVSTNGFRPRPGIVKKMADRFNPDVIIFLINENLANIPQALLNLFALEPG